MADAAQLPVPAPADSCGGVHILADALRRQRPIPGHAGPDQRHREERGPLFLPEESEPSEGGRPAASPGEPQSCFKEGLQQ